MSRHPAYSNPVRDRRTALLGTADPAEQDRRIEALVLNAQQADLFLLINWNPMTRDYSVQGSRGLGLAQVTQGLNYAREWLETQIKNKPVPAPFQVSEPVLDANGSGRITLPEKEG